MLQRLINAPFHWVMGNPRLNQATYDAIQFTITLLPSRLKWAPHNLISHPVSEVVYWVTGDESLSGRIHDCTLLTDAVPGEGRG